MVRVAMRPALLPMVFLVRLCRIYEMPLESAEKNPK